jgi:cytochrome P450
MEGFNLERFPLQALAGLCAEIIGGATSPTGDVLGNFLLACLAFPEALEKVRRAPSLWEAAVNELLRYDGPVIFWGRMTTQEVVMSGKHLRVGEVVYCSLSGANRDPDVFPEPDRLGFSRPNLSRHLVFSPGSHYCTGAGLAKLEMSIVLEKLFRRLPRLRLAGPMQWRPGSLTTRGPTSLPVEF